MTQIEEGITKGETQKELMARIKVAFDGDPEQGIVGISDGRAKNIASTETGAAYGYARHEGMKEAGIETKTWVPSHIRTREWHEAAGEDDRNINTPIDQPFIVENGDGEEEELQYPGDPNGSADNVCNCHCISIPGAAQIAEEDI